MLSNMDEIGKRIRTKRIENSLKQQTFAEKIHIDKSSLNRYENGKQTPSLETIVLISQGLNVSIDYLLYGEENNLIQKISKNPVTHERRILSAIAFLAESDYIRKDENDCGRKIDAPSFSMSCTIAEFLNEIDGFKKCRGRIDADAYTKGIRNLIKEYENKLLADEAYEQERRSTLV